MRSPGPSWPDAPGLTDHEAETVRQLADLTGLPPIRIMHLATRSAYHFDRFHLAQALACQQWSFWPGKNGEVGRDPVQQHAKLRRCAEDIVNPPRWSDHPLGWD